MKKTTSIRKKKSLMRVVLLFCVSLFVFGLVMTIHQAAQAEDIDLQSQKLLEVYREKKYIGALDEDELKVLATIQTSNDAKKKSQEAEEGF